MVKLAELSMELKVRVKERMEEKKEVRMRGGRRR